MTVLNVCSPLQLRFSIKESFGEKPIKRKIFIQSQRKKYAFHSISCWQCFFNQKTKRERKNMRWGGGVGNSFLGKKRLLGIGLQFYISDAI